MPTMIQRYECEDCNEVYEDRVAAEQCSVSDRPEDMQAVPNVTILDLWECDGDGCQNIFDSQGYAERCETEHETAGAEGRTQGLIADMFKADFLLTTLWIDERGGDQG